MHRAQATAADDIHNDVETVVAVTVVVLVDSFNNVINIDITIISVRS